MKHKKLILLTALLLSLTFTLNAQFVTPKKKQKTVRHGQWHPAGSNASLNPKTVVLNHKYDSFVKWQSLLGKNLEGNNDNQIKKTYLAIFGKADTTSPEPSDKSGALKRALDNRIYGYYAKLCAFIYYADIDEDLDANDHWQKLSDNKREYFKNKAIDYMRKIDYRGHIKGFEKLQYSSKGLLMALQAYDLLKAGGNVGQSDLDNMKYSLQWWAKDVYRKANNERFKKFSFRHLYYSNNIPESKQPTRKIDY